jgi:hypothetical protein
VYAIFAFSVPLTASETELCPSRALAANCRPNRLCGQEPDTFTLDGVAEGIL